MRYHDMSKVAGINSGGLFSCEVVRVLEGEYHLAYNHEPRFDTRHLINFGPVASRKNPLEIVFVASTKNPLQM
jgi:hypothetical protein